MSRRYLYGNDESKNENIVLIFQIYETKKSYFNRLNYNVQANTPGVDEEHIYIHCEIAIGDKIYGSLKDRGVIVKQGDEWSHAHKKADDNEARNFSIENGGSKPIITKRIFDVTKTDFYSIDPQFVTPNKFRKIKELADGMVGKEYCLFDAYASALQAIPICNFCCIPGLLKSSDFSNETLKSATCSQLVAWLLHRSGIFEFSIEDSGTYLGSDFGLITTSKLFAILNRERYLQFTVSPGFTKTETV